MAWGVGVKPIVPKGTKPPRYLDGAADPSAPAAPAAPVSLNPNPAPAGGAKGPAPIPGVSYTSSALTSPSIYPPDPNGNPLGAPLPRPATTPPAGSPAAPSPQAAPPGAAPDPIPGQIDAAGNTVSGILGAGATAGKAAFDPAKAASTTPSSTAIAADAAMHTGEAGPRTTNYSEGAVGNLHTNDPGHLGTMAGAPPTAPTSSSTVLNGIRNAPPPNLSKDAYGNTVAPKFLSDLNNKPMAPDPITGLAADRRQNGYGVDPITGRLIDQTKKEGAPTLVEGQMNNINGLNPSLRTDGLTGQISGSKSASGGLLGNFDPTKTMAVGDVYNRIANDSGPSNSEGYFKHMMAGDDPSLLRARDRMTADAERSAAAVGGFSSGQKMRLQREQNADFEAKQVKYLGDLAGQADTQKNARYATLEGAATPYDQTVMQGRNLQGTLAGQQDTFNTNKNKLLGDLATTGDANAINKVKLGVDAAGTADTTHTLRTGQVNDLTKTTGEHMLDTGKAVDTVTGKASDLGLERDKLREMIASGASKEAIDGQQLKVDAASHADSTTGKYLDTSVTAANNADQVKQASDRLDYDIAHGADAQTIEKDRLAVDAAKNADTSSGANARTTLEHQQYISDLAAKVSGEQNGAKKEQFDESFKIAEQISGIDMKAMAAQGQQAWNTMLAKVEYELRKRGMDAQTSQNHVNNILMGLTVLAKGLDVTSHLLGGPASPTSTSSPGGGGAGDGGEGAQPGAGGVYG